MFENPGVDHLPFPQTIFALQSDSNSLGNSSANRLVCRSFTSLPRFWLFGWKVAQDIYLAVCLNIGSVSFEFKDKKMFVVSRLYLLSKT